MGTEEMDLQWPQLTEEILLGVKEWRLQNPKATLKEIEAALDERWAKARARLIQDLALASGATEVGSAKEGEGTPCPECGHPLGRRGEGTRSLTTYYNQRITLQRCYGVCPACGAGIFPPG
jgi:predicted RNA-binding Zn-ribbon protein involved in translation (DUF1610 family)